ncbi:MAG: cytochrome P450 [Myxococcota bacterium]
MHDSTLASPYVTPKTAPGPRSWLGLSVARDFQKDPMGLLERSREEWGDVVRVPMGFVDMYLLAHPDAVKHVLQDNHVNYRKGFDYQRMEPLVGHGLLTSNGEEWKRHRRLAQPAFHRQRIAGFGATMVKRTQEALERWRGLPAGEVVDLHAEMMRLTLEVVGDALFSQDLGAVTGKVAKAMDGAMHATNVRLNQLLPLPLWVPTPFNRRYRKDLAVLDEVVTGIIRERRGKPASDDLLSMLMEARDEGSDAPALDDRALRDEVMTLVLAGHETTANALTFTLLLLHQHPEVREALEAHVAQALGGRAATAADVGNLGFAKQVAEEGMRLYPPAWAMGRQAVGDDVIQGFHVGKGSLVMLCPWLTHRDARFWEEPRRFNPSRFAPDAPARHRFAYFPFGGGPRLCIGQGFALMELQLVLATLAQQVRVEVLQPEKLVLEPLITLRPKGGLPARLHFR